MPEAPTARTGHLVSRYRPRTEGLFARIERWVHTTTGETHWRTISKDNLTSLFGTSAASRIADPPTPDGSTNGCWRRRSTRSVTPAGTSTPRTNRLYGVNPQLRLPETFERNRLATNRYPRRMYYGNLPEPLLDAEQHPISYADGTPVGVLREGRRYAFEVVFDYGDWPVPTVLPHPDPPAEGEPELLGDDRRTPSTRPAPVRTGRFSSSRPGFEIRTLRRCHRALMFHHFAELGGPTLVRSTDFGYASDADTQASLLSAVTVTGHDRDAAGRYHSAAMPALTFSYSAFEPHRQRFSPLQARGGELPPLGLNQPGMALLDLSRSGRRRLSAGRWPAPSTA